MEARKLDVFIPEPNPNTTKNVTWVKEVWIDSPIINYPHCKSCKNRTNKNKTFSLHKNVDLFETFWTVQLIVYKTDDTFHFESLPHNGC